MIAQPTFETYRMAANTLLEARNRTPAPGRPSFMNQGFRILARGPAFQSGGLYALFLDERLLYVGSFGISHRHSLYSGNVVRSRWWTHIASMTLRGYRLHIANGTLEALKERFGDHPVLSALADSSLHDDRGNLTTPNRMSIALEHWDAFCPPNELVLDRFVFSYVQINSALREHLSDLVVKKAIKKAEDDSIDALQPCANRGIVPGYGQPTTYKQVEDTLKNFLERQMILSFDNRQLQLT